MAQFNSSIVGIRKNTRQGMSTRFISQWQIEEVMSYGYAAYDSRTLINTIVRKEGENARKIAVALNDSIVQCEWKKRLNQGVNQ